MAASSFGGCLTIELFNGSEGTPARSSKAQKTSASAFVRSVGVLATVDVTDQQCPALRASAGGSGWPGRGFRSGRPCRGTALRRSRAEHLARFGARGAGDEAPFISVSAWRIVVWASVGRSSRLANSSRNRDRAAPPSRPPSPGRGCRRAGPGKAPGRASRRTSATRDSAGRRRWSGRRPCVAVSTRIRNFRS